MANQSKPGYSGGKARARKLSSEELTAQALKAVEARWAKADAKYSPRIRRALRLLRKFEREKRTDSERAHRAHVARKRREG